jgi:dTDP-4-amino-4,6-dideoxygalactose transaminase
MHDQKRIVPIAKPWLGEREIEAAKRAITSGWVSQGPEVAAFEQEFAAYVGAKHACAVSSCTTALHLGLLAVGVQPGDEVITASHSFIATANSIRYCGATPIFADIEPGTFNMQPSQILRLVTPRTRAILCVHQMGMPCDLKEILLIARMHAISVVEDAACAIGSRILWDDTWENIGKPHGDVACFSFHPRKVITTGDGGMITTSNQEWDERFHFLRQHGMSVSDKERHAANRVIFESYPVLGYNYRMTDVQAAIGREQVRRLPEIIDQRRFLASCYRELLADAPGIGLPEEPTWAHSNWQSYCVRIPDTCNQRGVMQFMLDRGVATRRGVMCAHREGAYANGSGSWQLPESEKAQDHSIILPLYHEMSLQDQDHVVRLLKEACEAT